MFKDKQYLTYPQWVQMINEYDDWMFIDQTARQTLKNLETKRESK